MFSLSHSFLANSVLYCSYKCIHYVFHEAKIKLNITIVMLWPRFFCSLHTFNALLNIVMSVFVVQASYQSGVADLTHGK